MKLENVVLVQGHHENLLRTNRGCVNDVISVLSGCPEVRDDPPCVCPILNQFSIIVNDLSLPEDSTRLRTDKLVPLIPLLMESVNPELETARFELVLSKGLELQGNYGYRCTKQEWDTFNYVHSTSLPSLFGVNLENTSILINDPMEQVTFFLKAYEILREACLLGLTPSDIEEKQVKYTEVVNRTMETST